MWAQGCFENVVCQWNCWTCARLYISLKTFLPFTVCFCIVTWALCWVAVTILNKVSRWWWLMTVMIAGLLCFAAYSSPPLTSLTTTTNDVTRRYDPTGRHRMIDFPDQHLHPSPPASTSFSHQPTHRPDKCVAFDNTHFTVFHISRNVTFYVFLK